MNVYEIIPGKLWQSGILGEYEAPAVDAIIDCTHDMDLKGLAASLYIHVPFDDAPLDISIQGELLMRLQSVAMLGNKMLRAGARVLTHCTAGINRSSLMDGMILILRRRDKESPDVLHVVEYIRQKRPGALTNESFAKYLQQLDELG